ncbi:hypothetical protein [Alteriqipengyuania lutimaris]|uniref:Uncharacterized protein n=1 Tax=Alteriqipengyuania lutimaris TaxID=1538146 RepID=A0A395LP59_9SPHN|nr:hypothetical protein [Alteriqipengyuania lutimaris]MBB3034670.1 hypothetical protein [Alteriqipengyuania lutimaris]RDS76470.1 hypothetical protein DL238_01830 [Alteriqipengyuania lutimaris]
MAGGSIAAHAETARTTAPVGGESELGGSAGISQLAVIALVAGAIFAGIELTDDDDDAVSA